MAKWTINKDSKIPLYLQLKNLIKYYISSGVIQNDEQLPGVVALSKRLEINFETVRKAYKELEKEGLIDMKRGKGTFACADASSKPKLVYDANLDAGLSALVRNFIQELLQAGVDIAPLKEAFIQAIGDFSPATVKSFVLLTECNLLQAQEIAEILGGRLNVNVRGVLLSDLRNGPEKISDVERPLLGIVTTAPQTGELYKTLIRAAS